jgi:hypothetical protein
MNTWKIFAVLRRARARARSISTIARRKPYAAAARWN